MASQAASLPSPPSPRPASPTDSQSDNTTPDNSQLSSHPNSGSMSPSASQSRARGSHPKGKRNRTSPADKAVLVRAYNEKPQPNQEEIAEITERVSMNKQAVRIWFQNRRQNDRRKARPLSPQLIESITQGRISVSRFADLPEHTPFTSEGFPPASQSMSPPEQRTSSSAHSDAASCRSDAAPADEAAAPAPSWSVSGPPGYLANRRNAAGAPALPSNPHHYDSFRSESFPSPCPPPHPSGADHDAFGWKPSSQPSHFRLSTSMSGQAEITTSSPPRPSLPPAPVEPLPWPELPRPAELRRSTSSAASSRRMPRLKRGRSSDVQVWEDCANAESREDPLIEQAKHESSGSAIAQISLLRSLSSASSNALEQNSTATTTTTRTKRRNPSVANSAEARPAGGPKRPRLERSWSTQARIETTSALSQRHNVQNRTAVAPGYPGKPKPMTSYDHHTHPSSLLAWESDKENYSPDEDGNPRPFRRTLSSSNHTTASGRRRLPTAAPSSSNWADKTGRNPRRVQESHQNRHPASLARSATSPSSWSAYSKQFQTTRHRSRGGRSPNKAPPPLIYEDEDGDADQGDNDDGGDGSDGGDDDDGDDGGSRSRRQFFERDDVHRFMAGEVSPSKKKEVDAAANLIALKFAR